MIEIPPISGIETLSILEKEGTMGRAALRMRLTQSAISKRIAALEDAAGQKCLERVGRNVHLTPFAFELLERAAPLLAELKGVIGARKSEASGWLRIAISESILSSWGAELLQGFQKRFPEVRLRLSCHRTPWVIEKVRSGEVQMGLCSGHTEKAMDLRNLLLGEEEMGMLAAGGSAFRWDRLERVIGIEENSATRLSVGRSLARWESESGYRLAVTEVVQSFAAAVALARAGWGAAFVPVGVARAIGGPDVRPSALSTEAVSRMSAYLQAEFRERRLIQKLRI
jgi:DNA-binding transcriptional LysR family regulator